MLFHPARRFAYGYLCEQLTPDVGDLRSAPNLEGAGIEPGGLYTLGGDGPIRSKSAEALDANAMAAGRRLRNVAVGLRGRRDGRGEYETQRPQRGTQMRSSHGS